MKFQIFRQLLLKIYRNFEKFVLDFNKIQILDENFLQNSFKVEKIFLNINKIKIMSSKIVENKTNLMYLGLTGSPCIDAFYGFRATLDVLTEIERNEAKNDILFGCNENL
ncbi:hypothetical protein PVAND_014947 [Polypedilum vanderplanki]|uniref:Uncharacterized protein n=1 Tax=Polypedilum vanderplanki TaxID=319348 RepID=A0A9J6BBH2_POLVA|nr:hypothetical protein PVAND_014947 [Polypedilum vanderplanki]